MKDDDALLRKLGSLAKEQSARDAPPPAALDDLARERIVAHLAAKIPRRRKPSRGPYVLAAGLAVAAAVSFAITRAFAPDPLPEYAMVTSGESTSRGPSSAVPGGCVLHARDKGSFEVLARTQSTRVDGPLVARAFLVKGPDVVPWPGEVEVSPQGSARILGANEQLAGAQELRVVVARRADDAMTRARDSEPSGRGWQVMRCSIRSRE